MLLPQSAQLSYFFTPYGWTITKGTLKFIGDAFLFVTKPHPEPFLGESGVCESGGKTEDENNLEGKGNYL